MATVSQLSPAPGALDQRLAAMEDSLREGLVPLWIFNDSELHDAELDRIYGRNWVFMAHETEVPGRGDYVLRPIGKDRFIVVRGDDGQVRVLFDSCRHHGASVCSAEKGSAKLFICPFHGWSFKNNGEIQGIPNKAAAYRGLDKAAWSLLSAPRVENYRGLIFVNLDPEAKPFLDHLGEFKWYLDLHLGLTRQGMEVIGEPHRWILDSDWKTGSDNFSGDSYHTQSLHRSVVQLGLSSPGVAGPSGGENDVHVTECGGHSTSIRRLGEGSRFFWGYPDDLINQFRMVDLDERQQDLAARSVLHTGTIFPNLSLIHLALTDVPGRDQCSWLSFRQWNPIAPGKIEVRSWILVPKEASEEYKRRTYKVATANFSVSGNFEQDDSVPWAGIARASSGRFAKNSNMLLNFQMGMEGISETRPLTDWPGPGVVYDSNLEEGVMRTFYNHWFREMRRPLDGDMA